MAGADGQDRSSPFAAMGDEPAGNVDPNGTAYGPRVFVEASGIAEIAELDANMQAAVAHIKDVAGNKNNSWDDFGSWGNTGGGSGGQADMEWNMLSELFDAISGIGTPGGASSGYACNFANGIGSPGGDGDGNPKTPMGPFPDDDASAYGPPSENSSNPQSSSKGDRYGLLEFITFENIETATGVVGKVGEYGEIGLDFLHYGKAAEVFGKVGTIAGGIEIGFNIYKYNHNEISGTRASYEITGTALSIGAPYAYNYLAGLGADAATGAATGSEGGPVGAIIGAGVGMTFWTGELFYDNVAKPGYDYMISNLRSIETHLGDGSWHP